jgi:hypothetical protein
MKYLIYLLPLFLFSCVPTEENKTTTPASTTTINLTTISNTMVVDDVATVSVSSNDALTEVAVSDDNFVTPVGFVVLTNVTSLSLFFSFDSLGSHTKYLKFKNTKNETIEKTLTFTVVRNNTLRIKSLQIISFNNINQTWDPEFASTDPERLADLFFAFTKNRFAGFNQMAYTDQLWHKSMVIQNQGTLTWDLTTANLYMNPNKILKFSLADYDGPNQWETLIGLAGLTTTKDMDFTPYMVSKPTAITFNYPDMNLQFIVTVDWQ